MHCNNLGDGYFEAIIILILHNLSDKEILEFASAVAYTSLFSHDATGAIKSAEEVKRICKEKRRKNIVL